MGVDILLHDHVQLLHVLDLTIHLVNFLLVGSRGSSETPTIGSFYQSTFMVKVRLGGGPSSLGLDFGLRTRACLVLCF